MGKPIPKPWPRLSQTLTFARHPEICQACGARTVESRNRWQEHDEGDQPEPIVVVLCTACAHRLIEPHPRLYRQLETHAPFPGAMPLCVWCQHREGVRCTHPDLKANGGPGLGLRFPAPTRGFWDGRGKNGRRTGGPLTIYHGPVSRCAGRTDAAAPAPVDSVATPTKENDDG